MKTTETARSFLLKERTASVLASSEQLDVAGWIVT